MYDFIQDIPSFLAFFAVFVPLFFIYHRNSQFERRVRKEGRFCAITAHCKYPQVSMETNILEKVATYASNIVEYRMIFLYVHMEKISEDKLHKMNRCLLAYEKKRAIHK